ncbi:MAG: FtsX-like permease family protein [Culturomica sp.]|jgi:lipoprotein-releasing system permease protein|nr:FtsX-like permease family protein [Culturomica sp.]
MRLPLFVAKRYLFSKKKRNAINIISTISVVGVAVGTAALITILSVFNGIDLFLQSSMSSLTPDLTVAPVNGKFAVFDDEVYKILQQEKRIDYFYSVVEENALLKYENRLKPVRLKGVTDDYAEKTGIGESIVQGNFNLKKGDIFYGVTGYGVAAELGIGLNFLTPMQLYYPNKQASSAMSASALYTEYLYPAGFLSTQNEIDEKLLITHIDFARKLFRTGDEISKIEIRLEDVNDMKNVKTTLENALSDTYKVVDKYELNRSFYAMMKSEKLVIFLILTFILLIASFNIIGSISMLIFDKREDLKIYQALGMSKSHIISIFRTEGNLITILGGLVGLIIGVSICWLQQEYGFLQLGNGTYLIAAYPVEILITDVVVVFLSVLVIGFAASYFPVKYLVNRLSEGL